MTKNTGLIIATFTLLGMFLGCASIMGEKTQMVGINSNPDQAQVTVTDEIGFITYKGQTPISVNLEKSNGYFSKKEYSVKISKEGYKDQIVQLKSSVTGWYLAGNIAVGGLIGWFIVDPNNGAMYHLSPDRISAGLEKTDGQSNNDSNSLRVVLMKDVPENLKKDMVRIN